MRRILKVLGAGAAILLAAPLLYTLAAFGALLLPHGVGTEGEVTLYACDNGVHTDLVLPVAAAGIDWRRVFAPAAFAGPTDQYGFVSLGWGSRDFYLNTPTWADVEIGRAVAALLWDETVVRAEFRPRPGPGEKCGTWRVGVSEYQRIAAYVRDSLRQSQSLPVQVAPGYGRRDAFFAGNGRYTIATTCNEWTAEALRLAGAPVAPWAPFSFLVLWYLPPVATEMAP